MAEEGSVNDNRPKDLNLNLDDTDCTDNEVKESFQGPHDWRKRLRPVQSPIKLESSDFQNQINCQVKDSPEKTKEKGRPLPPWKRDLIEKNKKVARLVRRESSGRSNRNPVVRESSGRSKRPPGSESPSGIQRKRSFQKGSESAFAQQVVNENGGGGFGKKRVSPANSFKAAAGVNVRRTPSDKVLDPNDPTVKRRVERVRRARLYLLQQLGPNSFLIVGDSPEHKFKVIIGPQTCSCGKSPQCVHVLFVMLRVFQVSESDPCLWSKALKNYEVESLFRAYNDKRSSRIKKERLQKSQKQTSPEMSNSASPETSAAPSESDAGSVREEDESCPICLLEMLEGESLLKCDGCQNRLHHHCITVWFDECRRQNDPLICPLCRTRWKNANVEVKLDETNIEPTVAPPNTRAPSPHHDLETARLPYAEPIPEDHTLVAEPWIKVLGTDLVACLFSRNWSIRETGLKHFEKEVTGVFHRGTSEAMKGSNSSSPRQVAMDTMLHCCSGILTFMCGDPVYKVFVGCLKVLRGVLANNICKDDQQRTKMQELISPVVDAIIVKCSDGNRRMSQLSLSTILELAKGQSGELAVGKEIPNTSTLGLGGMNFVVQCVTGDFIAANVSWQWILGRLYAIEKLIVDFPSEFLPRQSPDGASSESSLEAIGASCPGEEDKPLNYDRLLTIAEFAVKVVSNSHTRISRMAKRVFLLTARFSAHVESLITELEQMLSSVDAAHRKSLRRQFEKIIEDFQLSERIVQELNCANVGPGVSPFGTPSETPVSTPRCNSPMTVTSTSDYQSEAGSSTVAKNPLPVPPNTPIRDRRKQLRNGNQRSFNYVEEESSDNESFSKTCPSPVKLSRSLDSLDSIDEPKKSKRKLSKSPYVPRRKERSRSRTPQRVGPVLETDIDEAIRQQEERRRSESNSSSRDTTYGGPNVSGNSTLLTPPYTPEHTVETPPCLPVSPPPRLEEVNLETDIDTGEISLHFTDSVSRSCENLSVIEERSFEAKDDSREFADLCVLKTKHSTPVTSSENTPLTNEKSSDSENRSSQYSSVSKSLASAFQCVTPARQLSSRSECSGSSCRSKSQFEVKPSYSGTKERCSKMSVTGVTGLIQPSCSVPVSMSVANQSPSRLSISASQNVDLTNDLLELSPVTPNLTHEKPVTFQTEVAGATPKNSPSQTLDQVADDEECYCKEEVEKEEALALAKAMEVSAGDPPQPVVPGLTPMDQEQVITVQIQPDECEEETDSNGNPPQLYLENVHWQKGRLLGTGAFSSCYQARDVKTGILMAVKQISFCRNSKSEQEKVIDSITEEIQMMARLKHPNIVRIMGATRQGCHFNMFIEWMPGGSVSSLLGLYGAFVEDVITNYALQILRGLAYLHDNQVLHRDLKGANLLLDSTGQRLRIGDFGAAAKLASRTTGAGEFQGQLLGTIAFMAPEVLRGENYGRACDVWSVGCSLIEMATTKPPWNANDISNHLALIYTIANSNTTPPIPEKLAPPLRDLMLRCLEPVKEHRPTAKDLLIHPLFTQYMRRKK